MRVKAVIAAEKQIVDAGAWKDGKMPNTAFPLSKSSLNVSVKFRWRCIHFTAAGGTYRLLVFYRLDLEKCCMYLGRHDAKNMTVIARFEWHGTHEGWHFHVPKDCDDTGLVAGRTGGCDKRLPQCFERHRRNTFGVTSDEGAYMLALNTFRLAKPSAHFELVMQ